jgi:hypothetical protein
MKNSTNQTLERKRIKLFKYLTNHSEIELNTNLLFKWKYSQIVIF